MPENLPAATVNDTPWSGSGQNTATDVRKVANTNGRCITISLDPPHPVQVESRLRKALHCGQSA